MEIFFAAGASATESIVFECCIRKVQNAIAVENDSERVKTE